MTNPTVELKQYTPSEIENSSGLSAIIYRTGTQARFKATMMAALSSGSLPELRELTTRDDDDFSISLIDAWATVLDVLTFYNERIANENYLLTATERRSLKWLGELIGYRPRPGLAAETYLAFTVEDAEGAPKITTVPLGTQVQSIPKPDEFPQIFETMTEQEVRANWNAMKPRRYYPQEISTGMTQILLEGNYASLQPGTRMLIVEDVNSSQMKTIARVKFDGSKNQSLIEFVTNVPQAISVSAPQYMATLLDFESSSSIYDLAGVFGSNTVSWSDSYSYFAYNMYLMPAVVSLFQQQIVQQEQIITATAAPETGVFVFNDKASIFGHNAPDYNTLQVEAQIDKDNVYGPNWNSRTLECDTMSDLECHSSGAGPLGYAIKTSSSPVVTQNKHVLYLNNTYDKILPNSWIAVESPSKQPQILRVNLIEEVGRSQFMLNAKVSKLTVQEELNSDVLGTSIRDATVHCTSTPVTLALAEDTSLVSGNNIILSDFYPDLIPGQHVIVSGQVPDLGDLMQHERLEIDNVQTVDYRTRLTFKQSLANDYTRSTVSINANVIHATHGETQGKSQVLALSSGRADIPFQTVPTRHKPLTYLADPQSEDGATSTLEVRVDQVKWHEVESFYEQDKDARVFVTRVDEEDQTHIIFGDGQTGRRPSTGVENITGVYRVGIGLAGNVDGEQLSLLLQKPHGVRTVTNPNMAQGGADPDSAEDIRLNATLGMHTLGRIVSLQDYEDYARSYTGIGKAHAAWAWSGESQGIFITVSGQTQDPISSSAISNLLNSIRKYSDPFVPLAIQAFSPRLFRISAKVFTDPAYKIERVEQAIRDTLRTTFDYSHRNFGEHVTANLVIVLIQSVEGVIAVDLDELHLVNLAAQFNTVLESELPKRGDDLSKIHPATLLLLSPEPISLSMIPVS